MNKPITSSNMDNSFQLNSPTKPINLLNLDIINRYNLDYDEFSDSESPLSSQIHFIKKQSSPKINIFVDKDQINEKIENEISKCMNFQEENPSIQTTPNSPQIDNGLIKLQIPGKLVDDSFQISARPSFCDNFEKSAHFVQEKLFPLRPPQLSMRKKSVSIQRSVLNPILVPILQKVRRVSSVLSYEHKENQFSTEIFPRKSYGYSIEVPKKLIVGFLPGEVLGQSLVKIENIFFLMVISFNLKEEALMKPYIIHITNDVNYEEILKEKMVKEWEIKINFHKMKKNLNFNEEIKLSFKKFLDVFFKNFPFPNEKILQFFYLRSFKSCDLKIILKNALAAFKLENSQIFLADDSKKTKLKLGRTQTLTSLNISLSSRAGENNLDDNNLFFPSRAENKPHSYIVTFGESIKTMKYYNTIHFLNKTCYYIRIPSKNKLQYIRINFINHEQEDTYMKISYYEPMNTIKEYCYVTHEQDIEKLINVLQIMNKKQKLQIFPMYLTIRNELVGRRLYFFNEFPPRKSINNGKNQSPLTKMNLQALKIRVVSDYNTDSFINTFFNSKNFFEVFKLDWLGKCYAKITFYKPNEKFMSSNIDLEDKIFYKFHFFPSNSKTKRYKFLISLNDIQEFLQININFDNERTMMIYLNSYVISKLRLIKGNLYHFLGINFEKIFHYHSQNKRFITYKMKFHRVVYEDKEKISFLKKEYMSYRTILHVVKKIKKEFCILTIQKHNYLKHWVINIYVKSSNRRFLCYITNEDIIKMSPSFLEDLYPIEMGTINQFFLSNNQSNTCYKSFISYYENMRTQPKNVNGTPKNLIENKKITKQCHLFIEMKFWEDLLKKMHFSANFNGKLKINIDNFKGIIREFLFQEIFEKKRDNENLYFLEVFCENRRSKSPIDIFNCLPQFTYQIANNYNVYIRLTNLQNLAVSNEKFTLRDLIYSYSLEEINGRNIEKLNKMCFLQSELIDLCNFLKFKIRNMDLQKNILDLQETPMNLIQECSIKKDITGKTIRKINSNILFQNIHFNKERKFILIYRSVFTLRPLKIATVSFAIYKMAFYIDIYDLKNSQIFSKKIKLLLVKKYLPFIKEMISWNLFYVVGERLIKIFKNNLIVESFLKSKSSNRINGLIKLHQK